MPQVCGSGAMDISAPNVASRDGTIADNNCAIAQQRTKEVLSSSKRQAVSSAWKARGGRLRKDFVPMCDEDVAKWMRDRQADMQDATSAGNAHEVARLCHIVASAANQLSKNFFPIHGRKRDQLIELHFPCG